MQPTFPTDTRSAARRPTPAPARRAFSLVEAAAAVALTGLVLVSALNLVATTSRARRVLNEQARGLQLARELMAEVLTARVSEPDDLPTWGREAGEAPGEREAWDDLDDYDGWIGNPPVRKDGSAIADTAGWERRVAVEAFSPVTMDTLPDASSSPLRRITVTVVAPTGETVELLSLRATGGALEQPPPTDATYLSAVAIELETSASPVRTAGVELLNHVEIDP